MGFAIGDKVRVARLLEGQDVDFSHLGRLGEVVDIPWRAKILGEKSVMVRCDGRDFVFHENELEFLVL